MNPTGYVGVRPLNPGNISFHNRDPNNLQDVNNYQPGDTWMCPTNNHIWMLMRDFNLAGGGKQAVWVQLTGGGGGAGIQTLTGDNAIIVAPTAGNCNVFGTLTQGIQADGVLPDTIKITAANATAAANVGLVQKGVAGFNSSDFTVVGGFVSAINTGTGTMKTLSGDDAIQIPPDGGGNTKILGTAAQGISTSGVLINNEVQITAANATAAANIGLAQRGVAAFNSSDFTVVNGFVSSIATKRAAFRAYSNTVANVTGDGTLYNVQFTNVDFDITSNYDGVTTFSAPQTGLYLFGVTVSLGAVFTSFMDEMDVFLITTAGTIFLNTVDPYEVSSGYSFLKLSSSQLIHMNAGNSAYIALAVHGGTKTIGINPGASSVFWGYQVA